MIGVVNDLDVIVNDVADDFYVDVDVVSGGSCGGEDNVGSD